MKDFGLECVILALTTMMEQKGKKRGKTDKRDAKNIAKYLACHTCSPGHISTEEDEPVYEAFVKAESLLLLILCE